MKDNDSFRKLKTTRYMGTLILGRTIT